MRTVYITEDDASIRQLVTYALKTADIEAVDLKPARRFLKPSPSKTGSFDTGHYAAGYRWDIYFKADTR